MKNNQTQNGANTQVYVAMVEERQKYAENAYNLGKTEYLAISIMSPEEATQFQEMIQKIMNSELTLEEQEDKIEEVFKILQEYIAGEEEPRAHIGL